MKGEFYKMEYEAWDEGTDGLSLELEGAYLRLCHQMYRRHGAIPDQVGTLCRIWRCHKNKAAKILDDLVSAGKIVRGGGLLSNGRVFGELERRDSLSKKRSEAGQKGGKSRQVVDGLSEGCSPGGGGVNPTQPLQPGYNQSPCTAQISANPLETHDVDVAKNPYKRRGEKRREEYIEEANASSHPKPAAWGSFEDFWRAYPNKVGRDAAKRKFDTVRKSGRVEFADLMGGLERYKESKPPDRDWCHPTTWLNQGRWQDQPAEVRSLVTTVNGACNVQTLSRKRKLSDAIADAKDAYRDLYGTG